MTNKEIKTLTAFYGKRIDSIKAAIMCDKIPPLNDTQLMQICEMLQEYTEKLDDLTTSKEYMINFEGGGWNTTYAISDENALKHAKKKYDGEHTKVKSVRLATKSGIDAAMRSFY
jgi:hypothetical protein